MNVLKLSAMYILFLFVILFFQRDKSRIVTYRVPPNAAVQVYDHRKQDSRVVFGPNLVRIKNLSFETKLLQGHL